jgi:hypothetical protein
MKKIILAMLCLSAVVLTSCQRDDEDPLPTAATKILGAWKVDRAIDEDYHPVNTLVDVEEYIGLPGDSVVFKTDGLVYTYSDVDGKDETDYIVLDEKTIKIEDELYEIKTLTDKELYLYLEEKDPAQDTRFVQKLYFKR